MSNLQLKVRACGAGAACAMVSMTLPGAAALGGDHHFETIALSGDAAPGTESGVVFSAFNNPLNFSMMAPAIDELGNIGLTARVSGPGVDETNRNGIWVFRDGALSLVVRSGQPAPGLGAGMTFNGFPLDYIPDRPRIAGGNIAFVAELRDNGVIQNGFSIWKETSPGSLSLVASEFMPAPGTDGVFRSPFIAHYAPDGALAVSASLSGGSTTVGNDTGIWLDDASGFSLLLREGDPAPGLGAQFLGSSGEVGTTGVAFRRILGGDDSISVQANVFGEGVDAYNDEAMYVYHDGAWSLVVREGDDVPGYPNNTQFGGGSGVAGFYSSHVNGQGHIAFDIRIHGQHVSTTSTIWSTRTGSFEQIDLMGEPAPGTNDVFTMVGVPQLNNLGQMAFSGRLTDDDTDPYTLPPGGIWSDRNGTLEVVVMAGDPLPDRPGWFINNTGTLLGFNDEGEVLVSGSVVDPEGGFHSVILLLDREGDLVTVAATNEPFTPPGTIGTRTVQQYAPTTLSETGETAVRLDFADGSSGVFAFRRGPAPCAADHSGDGTVDIVDLLAILGAWGTPAGDVTGDGTTDIQDLLLVLGAWGACGG